MVGKIRIELTTPTVSEWCSNQLSYFPKLAEVERFELPRPFGRLISNQLQYHCAILPMADREGFEPPIPLLVCRFSRPVYSATLPSVHWCTNPVTLRGLNLGKVTFYYLTTGAKLVDVKRLELLTLCV